MTKQLLEQQITAYRLTLAQATKECPKSDERYGHFEEPEECKKCQGTGRVARFPEFRQECPSAWHVAWKGYDGPPTSRPSCEACNGIGRQVAPAGLEAALAGLTIGKGLKVYTGLGLFVWNGYLTKERSLMPMPSADAILAEGLWLVIEVAGLE